MTSSARGPGDAARRAAAAAASTGSGRSAGGAVSRGTVLAPTTAQRALVPLAWGPTALVVALLAPLSGLGVAAVTLLVAAGSWLLAGRSAVLLPDGAVVLRGPVGQVVVPLDDVRAVERVRRGFTERAELVCADGRRRPLPAPQNGPLRVLRDPAFDEGITLIRYRVARGAPPARGGSGRP